MDAQIQIDETPWEPVTALAMVEAGGLIVAVYDHPVECGAGDDEHPLLVMFPVPEVGVGSMMIVGPDTHGFHLFTRGGASLDALDATGGSMALAFAEEGFRGSGVVPFVACGSLRVKPIKPPKLRFERTDLEVDGLAIAVDAPRWPLDRDTPPGWSTGGASMHLSRTPMEPARRAESFANTVQFLANSAAEFGGTVDVWTEGTASTLTVRYAGRAPEVQVLVWTPANDDAIVVCQGTADPVTAERILDACMGLVVKPAD